MSTPNSTGHKTSRRSVLLATGAGAFAFHVVPRHVLGGPGFTAPSERVNVAGIGAGGMGGGLAKGGIRMDWRCAGDGPVQCNVRARERLAMVLVVWAMDGLAKG